ncbi:MAG: 3-dehydroquinate synthase [Bacillus sp. (in: firmicutes)]
MKKVEIETESKRYPVFIGSGILGHLAPYIKTNLADVSNIWIIVDKTVSELYLGRLKEALGKDFGPLIVSTVPAGEHCKTFSVFEKCHGEGLAANANRKTLILALGGGAVGDLAGFVAATYMRGIRFIGIPTTILAHDSAVGGKVAINHPLGKNMVGAFHQPEAVFYDLSTLSSLPEKEWRSGFAEAVKHALIQDKPLYDWMRSNIDSLDNRQMDHIAYAIEKGIQIKAAIVQQDERESGIRAYLNFGHTLGHAIEANVGYGVITHGESVLIGMIFALRMSVEKAGLSFDVDQFQNWAEQLGYRTALPQVSHKHLLSTMKKDKKTTGDKTTFILLKRIGEPIILEFGDEELIDCLSRYF